MSVDVVVDGWPKSWLAEIRVVNGGDQVQVQVQVKVDVNDHVDEDDHADVNGLA